MERRYVLHFVSPLKNVSPFDVNMAVDAGWDVVVPYTGVELSEVAGLAQDAIFSREPKAAGKTGMLVGGRDPMLALDMLKAAKGAMFPPFQISVMADPSGAFTTAAGMIAVVERHLRAAGKNIESRRVAVYGATGPVGGIAGLIAAQAGAEVTLVGYDGPDRVRARAEDFKERFDADVAFADGSTEALKTDIVRTAEIVLCAGRAGLQLLSADQMRAATDLIVALDINAVPPSGIEGVGAMDDGVAIEGTDGVGVGALAVGKVKSRVEHELLKAMRDPEKPLYLDFADAFAAARRHAA